MCSWCSIVYAGDYYKLILDLRNILATAYQSYIVSGILIPIVRFISRISKHQWLYISCNLSTLSLEYSIFLFSVALTACANRFDDHYITGQIIKFPQIKTSSGINNVAEFQNTGKFTCEKSGFYLFTVHITKHGSDDSSFELQRNGQVISRVMILAGTHSDNYYSASGTVVVQINAGDTLFARVNRPTLSVTGTYSCFTVIKINWLLVLCLVWIISHGFHPFQQSYNFHRRSTISILYWNNAAFKHAKLMYLLLNIR